MIFYRSTSRRIFEVFLYAGFVLFILLILLPFINVIAISFSSKGAIIANKVSFWPVSFSLAAYRRILTSVLFKTSLVNTTLLTAVSTVLTIAVALAAGYAIANKHFPFVRAAFVFILIPMYFSGGLIPFYIIVNAYGLNNTFAALIFPYLVSVFYIIVFRNSIQQLPQELLQSAEIDGASEYTILFRIVFPLILPMVTAFTIFSAVGFWNQWFSVLIFIRDQSKWTLQYMLRNIYLNPMEGSGAGIVDNFSDINPQNIVMAAVVCTILPIIVIYPFLQRYFIHGVIVGAVKG
jgi:putative aldouronate transport system permease protein